MDQQPKIPTLKDAQKPQVKIKGMGAGLTLFDRLKQFKKKDLAFILAGLGTLFMAPLAEHFMMAPESGDASLQQGWGKGGGAGSNLFGSGSSPYENGNNSIAQGGAIGGSGDIITPLNVRDPSALVMGPGAAQQPPAGSVASVTPPPTAPAKSETDYKDALAGAASRAASAAVKKAPLPIPKIAVGGSGLRGLGAASGGSSSGSGSLGPINSGNLGQAGTGGGGLNLVRSNPNFRGAAGPRGSSNPSGLDGTKKAGANAGDAFSRTGSALGGLNAAASEQIPTGGQGFGGGGSGGAGANDKPGGGAGAAGSKSVGESLAFIEAKERMMENLKLEFEKKKLKDPELLLYAIRNDSLKTMATEATKMLTKSALGLFSDAAGAKKTIQCPPGTGDKKPLSVAENNMCDKDRTFNCYKNSGSVWLFQKLDSPSPAVECSVTTDEGTTGPAKAKGAASDALQGKVTVPAGAAQGSVDEICLQLASTAFKNDEDLVTEEGKKGDAKNDALITRLKAQNVELAKGRENIGNLIAAQNALSGGRPVNTTVKCKGDGSIKPTSVPDDKSVNEHIIAMRKAIGGDNGTGGVVKDLQGALGDSKTDPSDKGLKAANTVVNGIEAEYKATEELLKQARASLEKNPALTLDKFNPGEVQNRIGTYDVAWKDSTKLGESLSKIMVSLKPAVEGLVASGGGEGGSVKAVVDASVAFDKALASAGEAKIKPEKVEDPPKPPKDPVLEPGDITDAKKTRNTAPEGSSKEPPPAPGAVATPLAGGAKEAEAAAGKEKEAVGAVVEKIVSPVEASVAKEIKTSLTDGIPKNIAKVIKQQNTILVGIGGQSDMSTRPDAAPKK